MSRIRATRTRRETLARSIETNVMDLRSPMLANHSFDSHGGESSRSSADTTAPWPPLPPEDPSSFRWLQPGELLAIPVPTSALQLDALLRHLEIRRRVRGLAIRHPPPRAGSSHVASARARPVDALVQGQHPPLPQGDTQGCPRDEQAPRERRGGRPAGGRRSRDPPCPGRDRADRGARARLRVAAGRADLRKLRNRARSL